MRERWQRYWFGEGERYSLAIIRIGVALAVWLSLDNIQSTWPLHAAHGGADSPGAYHAVGLWRLAGSHVPPLALLHVLWPIAKVSTIAMGLGLGGRVASITSWLSACSLAALYYSGVPSWSHEYNVVFTVHLAIAFARTTDALSLDVLVRRALGRPPRIAPGSYQWAARLAQLACALMFASATYHKLTSGGGLSLQWALSDNLRNQLLVRFDAAGLMRTPVASWLIDDVWRYRGAAILNLVAQTAPLVACFLTRRPLLRAMCGACFVLETLGLAFVMNLWDLHWLPLVVVFVDWDRLLRIPAASPARTSLAARAFVPVFVVVAVATSISSHLRLYPFSTFPMFSNIRAREPYSVHQPYSFAGNHIELVAPDEAPPAIEDELDRYYTKVLKQRDRRALAAALDGMLRNAQRIHPGTTGLRIYYVVYETTPYPQPAAVVRKPIALIATIDATGVHSLLGTARREGPGTRLTPGESVQPERVEVYTDELAEPSVVSTTGWTLPPFTGRKPAFVATVAGERWLVAN